MRTERVLLNLNKIFELCTHAVVKSFSQLYNTIAAYLSLVINAAACDNANAKELWRHVNHVSDRIAKPVSAPLDIELMRMKNTLEIFFKSIVQTSLNLKLPDDACYHEFDEFFCCTRGKTGDTCSLITFQSQNY